jgi:hypothetical protein
MHARATCHRIQKKVKPFCMIQRYECDFGLHSILMILLACWRARDQSADKTPFSIRYRKADRRYEMLTAHSKSKQTRVQVN